MKMSLAFAILALALPGCAFGETAERIGAPDQPQRSVTASASTDPAEFSFDFEQVMAHPEAYEPPEYAETVRRLWERGDRVRAFFWYQVFSARTAVLLNVAREQALRKGREDEEFEFPLMLRIAGMPAFQWAMSDPEMANVVTVRAFEYESRLPPHPMVPEAMWLAYANEGRSLIVPGTMAAFETGELSPSIAIPHRRMKGLYVGPWQDPGSPLDDAWR